MNSENYASSTFTDVFESENVPKIALKFKNVCSEVFFTAGILNIILIHEL